ncbi:MAG: hypothetical protein KDA36_03455, partial [Planctomycetaceae bacterium]|nr:hypothetical protein [Planctomycetaceae bacterium]
TVNSFGNPPQYDPKKEDPQLTDSSPDETEVSFSTEVKDHFQTKHKFVVRKLDGVWKLAEVWSVLEGGFSDDPDRIL